MPAIESKLTSEELIAQLTPEQLERLHLEGRRVRDICLTYYKGTGFPLVRLSILVNRSLVIRNMLPASSYWLWLINEGYIIQHAVGIRGRICFFPGKTELTEAEMITAAHALEMALYEGKDIPVTYMKRKPKRTLKHKNKPTGRPKGSKNKIKNTHDRSF